MTQEEAMADLRGRLSSFLRERFATVPAPQEMNQAVTEFINGEPDPPVPFAVREDPDDPERIIVSVPDWWVLGVEAIK